MMMENATVQQRALGAVMRKPTGVSEERLLAELEELLRTAPANQAMLASGESEVLAWRGRAVAVLQLCDWTKAASFKSSVSLADGMLAGLHASSAYREAIAAIHEAQYSIRLASERPAATAMDAGAVFDYFDYLRRLLETARIDILIVDPYIDVEFVSRYLPHISGDAAVRMLTGPRYLDTLLPSLEVFGEQSGRAIEVRVSRSLHDRFILIDGQKCYQSGASFKDGARRALTVVSEIIDPFEAVKATYERLWSEAQPRA